MTTKRQKNAAKTCKITTKKCKTTAAKLLQRGAKLRRDAKCPQRHKTTINTLKNNYRETQNHH